MSHLQNQMGILRSLAVFLALASPLSAYAGKPLTLADVAKLREAWEVALSPDGKEVAYTLVVPRDALCGETGPPWTELHVVNSDGVSRPLVAGHVHVSRIAWTPDGISYLSPSDKGKASLYIVAPSGGTPKLLLSHEAGIQSYSWNSDRKTIAFLAEENPTAKGFQPEVYGQDLPPVRVWLAALDGSKPRALPLPGSASRLQWNRQGTLLAVALSPTSSEDDRYLRRKLSIVDPKSGQMVEKIDTRGKLGKVAWSPDGKYLAFVSAADPHDPAEGRLMVVPVEGGTPRDIMPGYQGHVGDVAWENADTMWFGAAKGVGTEFGRIRRDGSQQETVLQATGPVLTAFSTASGVTSIAFAASSAAYPPEVHILSNPGAQLQRLTNSNPWLDAVRLAPQESVEFKARDGLLIQGVLVRPLDQEKKRYPLIVVVHGGPEQHYSNGWITDYIDIGQAAAARGFAVFYINYRGSTGRGVAFSKLDQSDPAGKEFEDLIDGVDYLIDSGLVDKARVGITGLSHGGYASAWGATYYSDRFAASVPVAGVADLISHSAESGNPDELYQVHALIRPWQDWQLFLQRSPIYYVDRNKTPTLILQGKGDPTVTGSQALELYNYLRTGGHAPVRLVQYPGEGHGFTGAASRFDASVRLVQWMEHYLKGPGGAAPPYVIDYAATGYVEDAPHTCQ